jgi:AbrB family looped-hinge helix DNA binding protein
MVKLHGPKVYGAVTVGERGQIVIPAKVRKLYHIKTGDRLIVVAKAEGPIGLIPADQLGEFLSYMTEMLSKIKEEKPKNKQ